MDRWYGVRWGRVRSYVVVAVCAAALGGWTGVAGAQGVGGTVMGRVSDGAGAPLGSAQVIVDGGVRGTLTGTDGRFVLRGLRPGRYRLSVSLIGYAPDAREVIVAEGADAEEISVVLERTVLSLPGLQVTATPFGGEMNATTQGMTQLSGRALEREMAGSIAETLRFQPGMSVRSMGPGASAPIIRGLTGDRVLVLQDGHRAGDLAGSADDHGVTIDPLTAQRVEVVRGPATLLYGNNALGGVVNVITSDVPTSGALVSEWALSAQSESAQPGGSATFRGSVPLGDRWSIGFRAGGRHTDDIRIPNDPELGDRLANTQSANWSTSLGLGHASDRVSAGGAFKIYDFSYGLPFPPGGDAVSLRGRRYEVVSRAEILFDSALFPTLRVDATGQDYLHDELGPTGDIDQTFALDTRTFNVLVRQNPVGPFTDGAWGISGLVKHYAATGPSALVPASDSRGFGAFGFQEIAIGDGGPALQLGGRIDDYRIASETGPKFGPGRERSFRSLSGSLGVRVPLREGLHAGASLARSFRAPTVEELFSAAAHAGTGSIEFGDPELRAERGGSIEGVLQLSTPRWNGQLAAFDTSIDDYIHLSAEGDSVVGGATLPVFRYRQDDASLRGIEGQLEWAVAPKLALGVTGDYLVAGLSDSTPLSFMPPARLGTTLRWDDGTFSLGGDVHHEFRQDRVGPADETPTHAHTVFRALAGVRWRHGAAIHSVTLRGENLGNTLHREATSRVKEFAPGPGRNLALLYRVYF